MELQHQRIHHLCGQLKLEAMAEVYPQIAAKAVSNQLTFADFFASLLKTEIATRQSRSRQVLAKLAGFPVIKTLEQFDFTAVHGVTQKALQELSGLAFLERTENRVLLGPSGVGKTHLAISLGYLAT
jgi:DNA replication protein DnaC